MAPGQAEKICDALDDAKRQVRLDDSNLDIGNITIGAALGFLDFRLPSMNWRDGSLSSMRCLWSRRP
jgi:hypothetical protein